MHNLHFIDLSIVITYLLICLVLGYYKSKKVKNIKDYSLGNFYIPTGVLISTIFATHIGAGLSIGIIEQIFALGLLFAVSQVFNPIFWFIAAWIFGKNIEQFKGCLTLSDIMERLYGLPGRWVSNFASLLICVGVIVIQMTAMGFILNYFLGISKLSGIIIGLGVLVLYSTYGGVRIIALNDVFQFAVFFIAIPTACMFALKDVGGFSSLIEKLPASHTTFDLSRDGNLWLFISLLIYSFIPDTSSAFVQRFLMARSAKQLTFSLNAVGLLSMFLELTVCLMGFILLVKSPDIDPSYGFMHFIGNYLGIGIKGFLIAGLLAVVMSTADSFLNSASIIFAHDIIKKMIPTLSESKELLIARFSIAFLSLIAIFIASSGNRILELIWLIDSFWQPLILIPLCAGFLKFKTSPKSFISGSIIAVLFTCVGAYIDNRFATISMLSGLLGSILGLFGMHFMQKVTFVSYGKEKSLYTLCKEFTFKSLNNILGKLYKRSRYLLGCDVVTLINRKVSQYGANYYLFSILSLMYLLSSLTLLINNLDNRQNALVISYVLAITIAFSFSFYEFFSNKKFLKYINLYWYFALTFCLPLLGSFILFCFPGNAYCLINATFSFLLFAMFVEAESFVSLSLIGVVLAYTFSIIFKFLFNDNDQAIYNLMFNKNYLILMLTFMVLSVLKKTYEARIAKIKFLCGAIAHEISTPISIIGLQAKRMSSNNSRAVKEGILNNVANTNNIINTLLMNIRNKDIINNQDKVLVSKCIEEAIHLTCRTKKERRLINLKIDEDFMITCNKLYIINMFVNLLKNSLFYKNYRKNFKIDIRILVEDYNNIVRILDNGPGILAENVEKIFYPYYTEKLSGNGIGLSFCKEVMENHGGSIQCRSEQGEYALMELKF